jgi:hypothetical protein
MTRRRVELGDGIAYETCDPIGSPESQQAIEDLVRAAARRTMPERPSNLPVLDLQALSEGLNQMREDIVQGHNYIAGFEYLTDVICVLTKRVMALETILFDDGREGEHGD